MRKGLPPVNWLRAFEVAARHLSFTGAARELGVTPSAISQQVRLLEHHIGAALFDRLPRGLALSLAGESYLPVVAESFERLSRGTAALFGGTDPDRLSIRSTAGFARFWLVPRLPRFLALYPELSLRLSSPIWAAEPFETESDAEIRFGTGPWPGFSSERLTWDRVFPVCSPRLQSATGFTSPGQLVEHRLLHTIGFREGWSEWLEEAGVPGLTPASSIEFDTAVLSIELALAGQGIALARSTFADGLLGQGLLVAPFPQWLEATEAFYLLWPAARPISRAAQLFRDWLVGEAAGLRPRTQRRRSKRSLR